ncbi:MULTISPECIES: hypothetical protein [unclassified Tychonema]|uniref:hypothetical protein n=1 Tax=unclassified Tychonema TaxID=2642144 RepID=UPI001D14106D|nr:MULTISPECIES: hypothetical protein [unclassified Tychonema]
MVSAFNGCAFAPDGVTVLAGDDSGRVHFLRLEGGSWKPGGWKPPESQTMSACADEEGIH